MRLEEGFSVQDVCGEMGMAVSCLHTWIRQYQQFGEAGLQVAAGKRRAKLPAPITEKIIELKQQIPSFGIKRISQLLRRCFFLPASPETVRQHLHEAALMPATTPPKKRNLTRPRFFERATPNQMWQTDIFTFRLGGRYAYLIAFMDDYSRFIVGAECDRLPEENRQLRDRLGISSEQKPIQPTSTPSTNTASVLNSKSSPEEKVKLFRDLFRGRDDVYAVHWEGRNNGKAG